VFREIEEFVTRSLFFERSTIIFDILTNRRFLLSLVARIDTADFRCEHCSAQGRSSRWFRKMHSLNCYVKYPSSAAITHSEQQPGDLGRRYQNVEGDMTSSSIRSGSVPSPVIAVPPIWIKHDTKRLLDLAADATMRTMGGSAKAAALAMNYPANAQLVSTDSPLFAHALV
jgi:hypothetical protein